MKTFSYSIAKLFLASTICLSCQNSGNAKSDISGSFSPVGDATAEVEEAVVENEEVAIPPQPEIPLGAQALIEAYPDFIKEYRDNMIVFTDGTTMQYDDGREKDFATMLDYSDVEDMFFTPYSDKGTPEYLADAGRSRSDALFKKMYGSSEGKVRANLVSVPWIGETVRFTSVNGAAEQLRKVAEELKAHPELSKYLKSSGTFYWRNVRGANRMSAHSYGIAFDIGVNFSDYWLWKNKNASETAKIAYANRIPRQIVEIFRKHGFIWGGAWYHFDTMHFEYRPEILIYARLLEEKSNASN